MIAKLTGTEGAGYFFRGITVSATTQILPFQRGDGAVGSVANPAAKERVGGAVAGFSDTLTHTPARSHAIPATKDNPAERSGDGDRHG